MKRHHEVARPKLPGDMHERSIAAHTARVEAAMAKANETIDGIPRATAARTHLWTCARCAVPQETKAAPEPASDGATYCARCAAAIGARPATGRTTTAAAATPPASLTPPAPPAPPPTPQPTTEEEKPPMPAVPSPKSAAPRTRPCGCNAVGQHRKACDLRPKPTAEDVVKCERCGKPFDSKAAASGHLRHCKKRVTAGAVVMPTSAATPVPEPATSPARQSAASVPTDYPALARSIGDLVAQKQAAYGDSFGRAGAVLRILYPLGIAPDQLDDALAVVRVVDKLFRVATDRDALGESPFKDICGYSLLAVARVEREKAAANG